MLAFPSKIDRLIRYLGPDFDLEIWSKYFWISTWFQFTFAIESTSKLLFLKRRYWWTNFWFKIDIEFRSILSLIQNGCQNEVEISSIKSEEMSDANFITGNILRMNQFMNQNPYRIFLPTQNRLGDLVEILSMKMESLLMKFQPKIDNEFPLLKLVIRPIFDLNWTSNSGWFLFHSEMVVKIWKLVHFSSTLKSTSSSSRFSISQKSRIYLGL